MKRLLPLALTLTLATIATACKKQEPPPEGPPAGTAKKVSVADAGEAPPPPPPTAAEPAQEAPPPPTTDSRIPPELHAIMLAAQKHALATGRFPASWNEMITAGLITAAPLGKDGKPMSWRDFERAIDP